MAVGRRKRVAEKKLERRDGVEPPVMVLQTIAFSAWLPPHRAKCQWILVVNCRLSAVNGKKVIFCLVPRPGTGSVNRATQQHWNFPFFKSARDNRPFCV